MIPLRVTGRQPRILLASTLLLLLPAAAQTVATGDSRRVTEPRYPAICNILTAQFSTSQRSTPALARAAPFFSSARPRPTHSTALRSP